MSKKKSATKKKTYEVAVRPCLDNAFDYTVDVTAKSARDAVAIVRKDTRKNIQRALRQAATDGFGFTVDFTASLVTGEGELREYHREDDYETEEYDV